MNTINRGVRDKQRTVASLFLTALWRSLVVGLLLFPIRLHACYFFLQLLLLHILFAQEKLYMYLQLQSCRLLLLTLEEHEGSKCIL